MGRYYVCQYCDARPEPQGQWADLPFDELRRLTRDRLFCAGRTAAERHEEVRARRMENGL